MNVAIGGDLAIVSSLVFLLGSFSASAAGPENLRDPGVIAAQAKACIQHWVSGQARDYVACLHPSVAIRAGGAKALAAMFSRSRDTSRGMGIELTGVSVVEPNTPVKIGKRYFAIVSNTIESIAIPKDGVENAMRQPSYYLAILEPGAGAWAFMDGWLLNQALLAKYLPDLSIEAFKRQLTLPVSETSR